MAIVVVLVGQCGNQLGDELFTQLALCTSLAFSHGGTAGSSSTGYPVRHQPRHATATTTTVGTTAARSPFFARDGFARCVLVDTEPKVVLGVRQRHANFMRPDNVVHGQSGRGNNWGLGYYGVKTAHSKRNESNAAVQRAFRNMGRDQREEDDNVLGKALEAICRETRRTSDVSDDYDGDASAGEGEGEHEQEEHPDTFEAIVVVHSLVGGTGSGLASKLTERLRVYFTEERECMQRDARHRKDVQRMMREDGFEGSVYGTQRRARHLVNVAVAPQVVGEVATQGLNAALTLQILQKYADAILLMRNDDAMAPGEVQGGSTASAGSAILSRCTTFKEANEVLVALLLPVLQYGLKAGCITRLLRQCIPPSYVRATGGNKILTLLPTPQRTYAPFRQCVHRALFYGIEGGRTFMPGYKPTVPIEELLSRTAAQLSGASQANRTLANATLSVRSTRSQMSKGSGAKSRASAPASTAGVGAASTRGTAMGNPSAVSTAPLPSRTRARDDRETRNTTVTQQRLSGPSSLSPHSSLNVRARGAGFRAGDDTARRGIARSVISASTEPSFVPLGARRRTPLTAFSPATAARTHAPRQHSWNSDTTCTDPRAVGAEEEERYGEGSAATYQRASADVGPERQQMDLRFDRPEDLEGEDAEDEHPHHAASAYFERMTKETDALTRQVFLPCSTTIPRALYHHYQQLRRAPVAKMFDVIDGVLVVNEARELDGRVLFPLLRSAALKVSTGAFTSSYEDVGVTSERVKQAVRDVAEVLANAEEL